MRMYVKTYNEIEGWHYWADAPAAVDFLRYPHRHVFHIITEFEVTDADREIEIFLKQWEIDNYLSEKYGGHFMGMSCEMIAAEILNKFGAVRCEVNEDGKGGAIVVR